MKEKTNKDIKFYENCGDSLYEFEGVEYRDHTEAMKALIKHNNNCKRVSEQKKVKRDNKYLELTEEPSDRTKTASDGDSTDYYKLPKHANELRHLISYKGMSKSRGDVFKACYRLNEKEGVDVEYDLNKMKFFVQDLIEMNKRGERL